MRLIVLFLLFIFLNADNNVTLQLRWKHAFQFAGFYIAKEKGFYKKYGLNVKIKEVPKDFGVIKRVLRGETDFGVTLFSDLVHKKLQKKDIVVLMPVFEKSAYAFLSINPEIKSIKDFKNKKVCMPIRDTKSIELVSLLRENGLTWKDLHIISKDYSLDKILQRKCDIYSIYLTDQPYYFQKKGIKFKVFSLKSENIPIYGDTLFTTNKYRFSHPKIVENFVKASKEGWKYAKTHVNETIDIILKKYNTQHLTKDKLLDEATKTLPILSSNFEFDTKKVAFIKLIYKTIFQISSDFNLVEFLYSPFIKSFKEMNFVKNHIINTINTTTWPPFVFLKNGKFAGIGKDFFDIVKNRLYLKSKDYFTKYFKDVLEEIKFKRKDITFSTSKTKERSKYAIFSKPYVVYPISIATKREDEYIDDMKKLKHKRVAIGYKYTAYNLVKEHYPFIKIIPVKTTKEGIELLEKGKVDAVIDIMPVLAYYISKGGFYDLIINGDTKLKFPVSFMIRDDYKILKTLIDRVINSINEKQKKEILNKYIHVNIQEGVPTKIVTLQKNIFILIIMSLIIFLVILIFVLRENIKMKKALQELAYFDKLTGIFNRRKLEEKFNENIELAKRYNEDFSIIYFDIDHFKKINDRYGHEVGDFVLKNLSQIVKRDIRNTDIFGRWGGEEFLILLPKTSLQQAKEVAEKLRKTIENSDFNGIKVTVSFGISEFKKEDNLDSLLQKADKALYKAKEKGRNRVEIN